MKKLIILVVSIALLVSCTPDTTQETIAEKTNLILDRPLGTEKFSLLEDRLFIRMPQGTETSRRLNERLLVPISDQLETRLILSDGDEQLSFFAQEMFAYSREDLWESVSYITDTVHRLFGDQYIIGELETDNGLEILTARPIFFPVVDGNIHLMTAYVKTSGGTMIGLGFYVSEGAFISGEETINCVIEILQTLEPGQREIGEAAYTEELFNDIEIDIPAGYASAEKIGPNVSFLYDIYKLKYIDENITSLNLYMGYSNYQLFDQIDLSDERISAVKDTILGKEIEWRKVQSRDNPDSFMWETLFEPFTKGYYMRIYFETADDTELNEILTMLRSMKVKTE